MSGHSKWNNIKRKKGAADAVRGALFTKIGREIQVAVKAGGPDPNANGKLKDIIAKAKANNMPNDNIQRSIDKAAGVGANENIEEIRYEGFGPQGVAIIVDAVTDNRNRTAADVRHIFAKFGGNMGTTGCAGYLFQDRGQIYLSREAYPDAEKLLEFALESGASDFSEEEEVYLVTTEPSDYEQVREVMSEAGYEILEASLGPVPDTTVAVSDPEAVEQLEKLLDNLEENDDVMNVYHNWDS